MLEAWRWLISDRSLPVRIAIGAAIFAVLAILDYRENGKQATRWREYAFLLVCVACALFYGIANDLITSRISVEYFLFGKGVAERVSGEAAADPDAHRGELDLQAIRIGALATWSAGLIAGAAMLVTNTLSARPRLRMRAMLHYIPLIGLLAIAGAVLLGWVGSTGFYTRFSRDFATMVAGDEMRPFRFMAVFGIHLGGYLGALVGLVIACVKIWMRRGEPATAVETKPSP